jgi:hypothetical protein
MHIIFYLQSLKGRYHLADLGVEGRVLKWILREIEHEVKCNELDKHTAQFRVFVNS